MIKLENVTKIYRNKVQALSNVNVFIEQGEFVYLIGATGSGKSTFMKLLYREEKATMGSVFVAGVNLSKISNRRVPKYRRKIGVVFQDYKLLQDKTVYENVAFAMEVIGAREKVIRKRVMEVLTLVGLQDKARSFPRELSGGQQQRVSIARAIVNNPSVLIADEPTGNLDPTTSLEIMTILERINEDGTTVVMVTHDQTIVDLIKKRTIMIDSGYISTDTNQGGYLSHEAI